jgi:hypothetical protein
VRQFNGELGSKLGCCVPSGSRTVVRQESTPRIAPLRRPARPAIVFTLMSPLALRAVVAVLVLVGTSGVVSV